METFPKRAAAYCRVSTETEMQDGSFWWQQEFYRELLSRDPGLELVGIYADRGLPANRRLGPLAHTAPV